MGILSKKILDKNIIELPGIDHPDNFMKDWEIKELKLALINQKLKVTEFDIKKPCSIFLGGYVRIDITSVKNLKIFFYTSSKLYIHKSSRGDEVFEKQVGKLLVPSGALRQLEIAWELDEDSINSTFDIIGGGWMTFKSSSPIKISISCVNARGIIRSKISEETSYAP